MIVDRKRFIYITGGALVGMSAAGCASSAMPNSSSSIPHYELNTPYKTPQGVVTLLEDGSLVRVVMNDGRTVWVRVFPNGSSKAILADTPDRLGPAPIRPQNIGNKQPTAPDCATADWDAFNAAMTLASVTVALISAAGLAITGTVVTEGMGAFFAGLGLAAMYAGWLLADANAGHYFGVKEAEGC